jgi:hypothetical protein
LFRLSFCGPQLKVCLTGVLVVLDGDALADCGDQFILRWHSNGKLRVRNVADGLMGGGGADKASGAIQRANNVDAGVCCHDFSLLKPEIKAVQYSDGEHDCASYEEAPQALCKASEDVSEPCKKAGKSYDVAHIFLIEILGRLPSCTSA